MNEQAQPPLVPVEVDLRDFAFMPLDIIRLFGSRFHAIATDAEWRAGVTLWAKSFHQVPAASIPDDDVELCRLAELGRDIKTWRKVREVALHGWIKCSDGRLYHPIVAEKANEAWSRKQAQRARSIKGNSARWGLQKDRISEEEVMQDGQPEGSLKDSLKESSKDPKGQGQGQGQGQGRCPPASQDPPAAAAPATPSPRGSRLSADWVLPKAWGDWALAELPGWSPETVRIEAAKFGDYWHAKTGKDATKADWAATWRNWCRNAKPPAPLGVAQRPDRIDRQLLTAGLMTGAIRPSEPTTTITTLETFDVAPRVIAA